MAIQKKKKEIKKSFFAVKAPITSTKVMLYSSSPESLVGKIITLDLSRNLKGKNMEMKMEVNLVDGELVAEPVSIELVGSYIRRMMRKGADYVEDSFLTGCKGGGAIVKVFLITRNKVSRAVRRELRNTARKHIQSHFTTRTAKELFSELISNKIQKELSLKLKKIYPLALCEIRVFESVKEKKSLEVK